MNEKHSQLKIALRNFGWSDKETDVYIAVLELGRGTVSEISRKAGINRTTGYDILSALADKGVVSISGKEPKSEYATESPQTITEYLKRKREELTEQIRKSEEMVPEFETLRAKSNRPRIRFYEGREGLEHVYEDTLTAKEPIRAYANVDDMHKGLPNYFPKYYQRRAGKSIAIRAIIPKNKAGEERVSLDKSEMRESALVPADQYYFSPEINIYDNKVMIASWREKLGIIIESAEIADAMKKIYELSWARAKELDKELKVGRNNLI